MTRERPVVCADCGDVPRLGPRSRYCRDCYNRRRREKYENNPDHRHQRLESGRESAERKRRLRHQDPAYRESELAAQTEKPCIECGSPRYHPHTARCRDCYNRRRRERYADRPDVRRKHREVRRRLRRDPAYRKAEYQKSLTQPCRDPEVLAARRQRPDQRTKSNERAERARRRYNAETLETAHRHGYEWTGPELEIASRDDLTAKQVALMLGRSLGAVRLARYKLRRELPRETALAGAHNKAVGSGVEY